MTVSQEETEPGHAPPSGDERYGTVTAAETGQRERASDVDRAAEIVADMADATLLRGVAAVVVGFIILTLGSVLAGRGIVAAVGMGPEDPVTGSFLAWNLVSRAVVAIVAGYVTARAAPRKHFLHGAALAGMVAFMAAAALFGLRAAGAPQDPEWYPVAMLFVGPLGVLAGAALRVGRLGPAARRAAMFALLAVWGCGTPPPAEDGPTPGASVRPGSASYAVRLVISSR